MSKIFICAETYKDAEICAYIKLNFPTYLEWIFVFNTDTIKYYSNGTLYLYANWYDRMKETSKLLIEAKNKHFTIITVE